MNFTGGGQKMQNIALIFDRDRLRLAHHGLIMDQTIENMIFTAQKGKALT